MWLLHFLQPQFTIGPVQKINYSDGAGAVLVHRRKDLIQKAKGLESLRRYTSAKRFNDNFTSFFGILRMRLGLVFGLVLHTR